MKNQIMFKRYPKNQSMILAELIIIFNEYDSDNIKEDELEFYVTYYCNYSKDSSSKIGSFVDGTFILSQHSRAILGKSRSKRIEYIINSDCATVEM